MSEDLSQPLLGQPSFADDSDKTLLAAPRNADGTARTHMQAVGEEGEAGGFECPAGVIVLADARAAGDE